MTTTFFWILAWRVDLIGFWSGVGLFPFLVAPGSLQTTSLGCRSYPPRISAASRRCGVGYPKRKLCTISRGAQRRGFPLLAPVWSFLLQGGLVFFSPPAAVFFWSMRPTRGVWGGQCGRFSMIWRRVSMDFKALRDGQSFWSNRVPEGSLCPILPPNAGDALVWVGLLGLSEGLLRALAHCIWSSRGFKGLGEGRALRVQCRPRRALLNVTSQSMVQGLLQPPPPWAPFLNSPLECMEGYVQYALSRRLQRVCSWEGAA